MSISHVLVMLAGTQQGLGVWEGRGAEASLPKKPKVSAGGEWTPPSDKEASPCT